MASAMAKTSTPGTVRMAATWISAATPAPIRPNRKGRGAPVTPRGDACARPPT
jgi:hypothetical protein